jgi:ribosomal protein RSM22 (predicted rRNA methylase)
MWNSGAEVIVIIDRGTPRGFKHVADARKLLLRLGQDGPEQEDLDVLKFNGNAYIAEDQLSLVKDGEGSYVVAPVSSFFLRF